MRRRRNARILFSLGWLGALGPALRVGPTVYGVTPEQVLGLLTASDLGIWGLILFLSRRSRTADSGSVARCGRAADGSRPEWSITTRRPQ
jgi:hypothetical protein